MSKGGSVEMLSMFSSLRMSPLLLKKTRINIKLVEYFKKILANPQEGRIDKNFDNLINYKIMKEITYEMIRDD